MASGRERVPKHRIRPGVSGLFLALTVAPAPLSAQTPEKDRQANDCYQAQAAYGNDQAACLIILFKWEGKEARLKALEFTRRDVLRGDSIRRAAERRADAAARAEERRIRQAERREDSLRTIQFERDRLKMVEEQRQDSIEYAVGGDSKRDLRRIIENQRDFFLSTKTFSRFLSAMLPGGTPFVQARWLGTVSDSSWTAETKPVGDMKGWRCIATATAENLRPTIQCDTVGRP